MISEPSKIWWDEITGPQTLVHTIAANIQAAKSIILYVPDDLPWRRQMRLSVERVLRGTDKELLIWCIDCQTDCQQFIKTDGTIDVAGYLLHERAIPEVRSGYRKASGTTIQQYMINNHVLQDRVVCVKGLDRKQTINWIDFCEEYSVHSQYDGVFVIESYEEIHSPSIESLASINYLDFVSRYDALLYNNISVAGLEKKEEWKSYIASVATMICNLDVELADAFITSTDFCSINIVEAVVAIAHTKQFENRYKAPHLDKDHPFTLVRNNRLPEIEKRIWKAQLQVLYPLLEIERVSFIEHYRSEIKEGFSLEYSDKYGVRHKIDQYGTELSDPYEAEIGTLYRMHRLFTAGDYGRYLLPILLESDRKRLTLIHEIRNLLAHVTACSVEQVNQFLAAYPFTW